jgi:hypothetical protein
MGELRIIAPVLGRTVPLARGWGSAARGLEETQRDEPAGYGQRAPGQVARAGPGRTGHLRHDLAKTPPAVAELDESDGPGVGAPAQREPVHRAELGLLHLGDTVAERDRLAQA